MTEPTTIYDSQRPPESLPSEAPNLRSTLASPPDPKAIQTVLAMVRKDTIARRHTA
jgi:hypothetical protein